MEPTQKCYDCGAAIDIENEQIKNGVLLSYREDDKSYEVFKCNECYKMNPRLADYKSCEVYSRVVGYLRPVQQWNEGKQQEYKDRKEYKNS